MLNYHHKKVIQLTLSGRADEKSLAKAQAHIASCRRCRQELARYGSITAAYRAAMTQMEKGVRPPQHLSDAEISAFLGRTAPARMISIWEEHLADCSKCLRMVLEAKRNIKSVAVEQENLAACPRCHSAVRRGKRFCSNCGASLQALGAAPKEKGKKCGQDEQTSSAVEQLPSLVRASRPKSTHVPSRGEKSILPRKLGYAALAAIGAIGVSLGLLSSQNSSSSGIAVGSVLSVSLAVLFIIIWLLRSSRA